MPEEVSTNRRSRDGRTNSIWETVHNSAAQVADALLPKVYDVVIVGAGITGLSTALLLQQAGRTCLLVEAHEPGFGTTGGTTAHLNTFFDTSYPEIVQDFGPAAARLVAEAGKAAIAMIQDLVQQYRIDCDFELKDGLLFSQTEEESRELGRIREAAQEAGVAVAEAGSNGLPIPFQQCLRFTGQAQFHPLKYLRQLAEAFRNAGGRILAHTLVQDARYDQALYSLETSQGPLHCRELVYATHIPPGINLLSFRCAPYRSYVLGIRLAPGAAYPDALGYDMQEPYHYFRTQVIDGASYLLLGGADHKTGHGDPEQAFKDLEAYARQYFDVAAIPYRWSAQYYVPADGLPYIGKMPMSNAPTYIATGFNGNGMIFGTMAARIITDLLLGRENKYADLFRPGRIKPVAGFPAFVRENADVAYHFVADRLTSEAIASLQELQAGSGRVVDFEGRKLAIYKSPEGKLRALSAICTHAACVVHFNPVEHSWDCPCHGGRFDLDGKVLTGPPQQDLEIISLE